MSNKVRQNIKYRENKLTVTRYVQNAHHWHEHKHASVLVNCVINQLQALLHMQQMLSQLISVTKVTVTYLRHI